MPTVLPGKSGEGCDDHRQKEVQPGEASVLGNEDQPLEQGLVSPSVFHWDMHLSCEGQADSGQWAGPPSLEPKNHCGQLYHPVKANQENCWAPSIVPSGAPWACRGAGRGCSDLHRDS